MSSHESARPDVSQQPVLLFCAAVCAGSAMACAVLGIIASWHWPLFGDAGIFHYIVSAIERGARPYRDIKDFNFPGTYALDALTMCMLGGGTTGERLYDACLCAIASAGFYLCLGRGVWARISATLASGLFIVVHLHDGLGQEGQRDFAMAALALLACGALLMKRGESSRTEHLWRLFAYELIVGVIFTIKPTLLLLTAAPLAFRARDSSGSLKVQSALAGLAGLLFAPAVMAVWLLAEHAMSPFFHLLTTLGKVHSELARKAVWHLLVQGVSPPGALFLGWAAMLPIDRRAWSGERRFLALAAGCGLVSICLQGKGLVYQRYPFLALLLLLVFYDFSRERANMRMMYVIVGLYAVVGLWFCPKLYRSVKQFEAVAPFESALEVQLQHEPFSGGVQCLDTYSGCLNTLYDMGLQQSSGELYDCYLFTAESAVRDRYRQEFLGALRQAKPAVLVLSDQDCFHIKAGFDRVQRWTELYALMKQQYTLDATWSSDRLYRLWSRGEVQPAFEVYRRRR